MCNLRERYQSLKKGAMSWGMLQLLAGLAIGAGCFLSALPAFGAETVAGQAQMKPVPLAQIFTFFFVMLGPIKIIGPFVKITQGTDTGFSRRLAFRAIVFSSLGLILATLLVSGIAAPGGWTPKETAAAGYRHFHSLLVAPAALSQAAGAGPFSLHEVGVVRWTTKQDQRRHP